MTVYASWNGDTRTAQWQLLTGPLAKRLTVAGRFAKSGFETAFQAPAGTRYLAVQALSASGAVLATSRVIGA